MLIYKNLDKKKKRILRLLPFRARVRVVVVVGSPGSRSHVGRWRFRPLLAAQGGHVDAHVRGVPRPVGIETGGDRGANAAPATATTATNTVPGNEKRKKEKV